MHHLPAYVALARLVLARRVVVVFPQSMEGPRCLRSAGARQVLVVGHDLSSEEGIDVRAGSTRLALRDRSVDVVCCIEALANLDSAERRELLAEAHRVLRPDGVFAGWIPFDETEDSAAGRPGLLDFWTLEEELDTLFEETAMLAQMPWQGFSVAPVLEEEGGSEPALRLDEALLEEVPAASYYLAVAGKTGLPPTLASDCVLVPVPGQLGSIRESVSSLNEEIESMRDEVARLREELSLRAARGAAAQGRVRELEEQLESVRASVGEARSDEVAGLGAALAEAEAQLETHAQREANTAAEFEEVQHRVEELEREYERAREERAALSATLEERSKSERTANEEVVNLRGRIESGREAVEAQRQLVRSRETDLTILSRTVEDQEKALSRVNESLDERKQELGAARVAHTALQAKLDGLVAERDELRRQVDVSIAEREGARTLAARVEAELEVANRRIAEQEESLAAKIHESSRLDAAAEAMRERLSDQESILSQTRERAEELSAIAAQGQMLSEVALDRDRLREELTSRQQQITRLEERLWDSKEVVQKEKIEGVRLSGDVERLREQLERSREVEKQRGEEVEELSTQLRDSEVTRAELGAKLDARQERVAQLEAEATHLAGESEDARNLATTVQQRGSEIARLKEKIAQVELRRQEAADNATKRENELREAGERLVELQNQLDEHAKLAVTLQAEVDVKTVEVEQLAATVANLQVRITEYRQTLATQEEKEGALQRKLEQAAAEQQTLRQRLREREQKLEDLTATSENDNLELYKLRKELEASSAAVEQLQEAIAFNEAAHSDDSDPAEWPNAAVAEIQRLKSELATLGQRNAEELNRRADEKRDRKSSEKGRSRRLQLEVNVRAVEQECMLSQLDTAEQTIWEMTDAADRNAARFEASLANLEKHKEMIDQLNDEQDVNRSLLAAEQARALELERLLASERAKLARAGLGLEGFPRSEPDDPFAGLDGEDLLDLSEEGDAAPGAPKAAFDLDSELIRLSDGDEMPLPSTPAVAGGRGEPGAVAAQIEDRSGRVGTAAGSRAGADRAPQRARLVVEPVDDDDDDEWPDDEA